MESFKKELDLDNLASILKKRYIDRTDNRKVFGVYSLEDDYIGNVEEKNLINICPVKRNT